MIDLHLHMDGSLSKETIIKLAKMQNIKLPTDNKEILLNEYLQVSDDCKDLNEYLKRFELPLTVLQTKESIEIAFNDLCVDLKNKGLIYAEIRFAPQLHCQKDLTQKEVVEAAILGIKKSGFFANLILCCMRGNDNKQQNLETVELTYEFLGKGVCACDLAGAEALFKIEEFEDVFSRANELKLPYTLHAGEADGANSVKNSVLLGAKRIGHGVKSIEDEEVINLLIEKQIPIEVCPKSNFDTKVFPLREMYPVKKLLDKGVLVTINTDNMTVSNTDLIREFKTLINEFNFTREDCKKVLINSIKATFLDENDKLILEDLLNEKFGKFHLNLIKS